MKPILNFIANLFAIIIIYIMGFLLMILSLILWEKAFIEDFDNIRNWHNQEPFKTPKNK